MARKLNTSAALITGAAKRIGADIAVGLAEAGFDIALHCNRSKKNALQVAAAIQKRGRQCAIFQADFSKPARAENLIQKVHKRFPRLNLLVNNASLFKRSSLKTVSIEKFLVDMHVHVSAPFILSRDFAKICKKGHIINILDTHIVKNDTEYFSYLLAKKSLGELTKLSALQLAPDIRVNGIAPGLILPPEGKGKAYLKRLAKDIPMRKKGQIANILESILLLVNNACVTGQIIFNDGGEHLL